MYESFSFRTVEYKSLFHTNSEKIVLEFLADPSHTLNAKSTTPGLSFRRSYAAGCFMSVRTRL